jgi:hypothetical protein
MANVEIIEAVEVTPELVEAFDRLVPQLSSSNAAPTETELGAIVGSAASILLLAVDRDADDRILGSLTLAWFRIPDGCACVDRGRCRRRRGPRTRCR